MPKAVVDTSVLVSAFLTRSGVTGQVLDLLEQGRFSCYLSDYILTETYRALAEPRLIDRYQHNLEDVDRFCEAIAALSVLVDEPSEPEPISRDPNDDQVLAAAVTAAADYLITGDKDLLVLERHKDILILPPRQFLTIFEQ